MMRRIDLLPSTYAERRRERRNIGLVMLAGLAVLALLLFYWVYLGSQVESEKNELAQVQASNEALRADIAQLQKFREKADEVAGKKAALVQVTGLDIDWPAVLTEIALVTPTDVWLTQLSGSRAGSEGEAPAPTELAEIRIAKNAPSSRLLFTGRALSMPAVAKWLLRLEEVRGVSAVGLQNAAQEELDGQEIYNFQSSVELNEKVLAKRFSPEGTP